MGLCGGGCNKKKLNPLNKSYDNNNKVLVTNKNSNDGKKIAVGAPTNSDKIIAGGCVYIYKENGSQYQYKQQGRSN